MRILIMTKEGNIGLAQRLTLEGNTVDVWCPDDKYARCGKGIVNRVPSWQAAMKRADLIVADGVGFGKYEDIIRQSGRPSLGFSPILEMIELDRIKGNDAFQRAGIKVPETHVFNNTAEAKKSAHADWGDGWVIKANGNLSTAKTSCVKDESLWDQAVDLLPPNSNGIIQKLVSGVEVSTEGWFNGQTWIKPFNHTFEEKKFLVGNLGQTTGCMGNVVLRSDGNKLTRSTVECLEGLLRAIGYRGPFDLNCIVNDDGAYALECTSRFGYDAIDALVEGLEEPLGELLFDTAMGTRREMPLTTEAMIAVRLSIPPWPSRKIDIREAGQPIRGIDDATLPHLFLCDVMKEGGAYVTAACDGVVLKATAIGAISQETGRAAGSRSRIDYTGDARRRVYRLLDRIDVRDKQYRTDIGQRVNGDMAKLREWGWV